MDGKLYIYKFIRDDGVQLKFDANELYLAKKNTLLNRPDPNTTAVSYTEADGGEMIRQKNNTYTQKVNGLIIPKTTDYWVLCANLSQFFRVNHTYKIIYAKKDGGMFAISNAWISDGLQIIPVPREEYSTWDITFTIGNVNWTDYAENGSGTEVYSNTVAIPLVTSSAGGEVWDTVGAVWDSVGEEWENGAGGVQTVNIASTKPIYPVWIVEGPCVNPTMQNNTTDTSAAYDGTVAAGQILTVDFENSVAYLDSALVTRLVTGLVKFNPGENLVSFSSDGGATTESTISWNNIIN